MMRLHKSFRQIWVLVLFCFHLLKEQEHYSNKNNYVTTTAMMFCFGLPVDDFKTSLSVCVSQYLCLRVCVCVQVCVCVCWCVNKTTEICQKRVWIEYISLIYLYIFFLSFSLLWYFKHAVVVWSNVQYIWSMISLLMVWSTYLKFLFLKKYFWKVIFRQIERGRDGLSFQLKESWQTRSCSRKAKQLFPRGMEC